MIKIVIEIPIARNGRTAVLVERVTVHALPPTGGSVQLVAFGPRYFFTEITTASPSGLAGKGIIRRESGDEITRTFTWSAMVQ